MELIHRLSTNPCALPSFNLLHTDLLIPSFLVHETIPVIRLETTSCSRPLLLSQSIPPIRNIRITKQRPNLLQRAPLRLWEKEVYNPNIHETRTNKDQVEFPADAVHRNGGGDQCDLGSEIEGCQAECDAC